MRTTYQDDAAAAFRAREASDEVFFARLEAASKPFGARDILISLAMAIGIMVTAGGIALVLNWAAR